MSSFLLKKKQEKTFEQKIENRSKRTREIFATVQRSFNKFCLEFYEGRSSQEIFNELRVIDEPERIDTILEIIQNWIDWNYKKDVLTSVLKVYFSKLRVIFHYEGFKIHPQDIKDNLIWKKRIHEERHALQMSEIRQILAVAKPLKRAFYIVQLSTGARPGEMLQAKKQDFDLSTSRIKITIHPENTKTRSGRSVYLTKEAASHVLPILKRKKDDERVFGKHNDPIIAEKSESKLFSRYCDDVGFTERYHSNNYRKITLYSFRSFFFGKCADAHREGYAHKMVGHGGYLPEYDRMNDEKKIKMFLDVEADLTVDQTEQYKLELEHQKKENTTNGDEIAQLRLELAQIKAFQEWKNKNTVPENNYLSQSNAV